MAPLKQRLSVFFADREEAFGTLQDTTDSAADKTQSGFYLFNQSIIDYN